MGQFTLDANGLNTLMRNTGVAAQEIQEGLQPKEYNTVIHALAIVYLTALNVIATIIKGRQSTHVESEMMPPVLPLELGETSHCDFIALDLQSFAACLASVMPTTSRVEVIHYIRAIPSMIRIVPARLFDLVAHHPQKAYSEQRTFARTAKRRFNGPRLAIGCNAGTPIRQYGSASSNTGAGSPPAIRSSLSG
ncbi:hypothetical protein AXG93_392s1360 [Marchantia polymorpha subsp. ruderalis]|uniref:Uncharacterized protein n=1 Tax=Marchantia polymorpha subsp. ruderalis TaxID=1480154 RepID=A0A176WQ99_MARPO|nr:hypothetical protein AXG93_392s1360 [Marchantia polymorpha subsp. ruderalis]